MGTQLGNVKSKADNTIIRHFVKDIKANGECFIRSKNIVDKLLKVDSSLEIVYCEEERCFIATYQKKNKL